MNRLLLSLLFFFCIPPFMDCDNCDATFAFSAFLYTGNGKNQSCQAFLIYKFHPPYNTISSISNLLSSDPPELARINNFSSSAGKSIYNTYFTIANYTFEGLATLNSLIRENNCSGFSLDVVVAIKKMSKDASDKVTLLRKINHFNLIRPYTAFRVGILGFRFALDVTKGLHYFTDPTCVHKRICSNVLLNRHLKGKIGNFSLAHSLKEEEYMSSSMRLALGGKAYTAPEYIEYGLVTPEIYVYAFWVVLLELVTRKEAEDDGEIELGRLIEPCLMAKHSMKLFVRMVKLNLACLEQEPESRPSMAEKVSSPLKVQVPSFE
uniref:Protein kinase domain-containing protein n=1 Tax=Populus trichocarpa TaxID=3694 RepID=A0A2K1ZNJ7_POPTR